ncbi:glycosyltransferase family 4 protein [Clostridium perfringens]|uniref:glycosyltransferase family 4 protein n=1 Tax=Clostridium perfringens TaxID=1502 RepID=UPI0022459A85|nr:glycosyltransferase family 4 protein [Clostridium perfringens]MCX0371590.1 glycosyltransferase family 4 protein [Clostridium perfringens]
MKVLILTNSGVGLYKFRKEIIQKLIELDYEVIVSLPEDEYVDSLKELGCSHIQSNINRRGTNFIQDLKLLYSYIKIIKKVQPDIVLTYTVKPNAYGGIACRILGVPYIANITGLGTAVENSGIIQNIIIILYRIAFKKINCLFFQNTENMQFFIDKNISVGKHRLIPGSGVNLEHFHILDYPPDETVEFVFISRIMKEKGIDQYIEAAQFIRKKYLNTRFHVCGFCEEEYEDILKELQEKKFIIYHGMQRDIRKILAKTHCTIHPTYYPEGMSNILLESSACGRPIITTDRSGCREIVEDGINGYIVKQKDSKDLIEKIEMFLKQNYENKKKMGINAREKVEREFDRQIVVNAYVNEIQR